ncbi:TasA anchoring/assembly protein [Oceanobacillus limi]|uniref:TasA anchoring/assembly protein n=1 Tax=Oceanobacillus limi TaxID=930131 RepID=A0A1I0BRR1_9BACI|nr:amyloid fiber anchoring/assembly protein TapA [Oceanobacillus limi]SET08970.1 TasA anchoring/assembly protein [Oceanobacillus limi]
MSRLQKFKKKKKLVFIIKLIVFTYIVVFGFSYISSGTGAYFNTINNDKFSIQAGTWWDGSDLEFTGVPNQNVKACPEIEISVQLINNGFSMIGPSDYKLYYVENGNPKQNGEEIKNGTLNPIEAGEYFNLTHVIDAEGVYSFQVSQRPGYEGDSESEIWSEKVMVKCKENDKEEEESDKQDDSVEETNENEEDENESDEDNADEQENQNNEEIGKNDKDVDKGDKNSKKNEGVKEEETEEDDPVEKESEEDGSGEESNNTNIDDPEEGGKDDEKVD